jgi:hypothetical protein
MILVMTNHPVLRVGRHSAQAAKMGYRWKIGNGENVRFWENQWFGSYSLAIQF